MSTITLNLVTYDHILNVDFIETNRVTLPEWINDAGPDVDSNVWDLSPLRVAYTLRVTNAEKWLLDQILTGHASVKLTDATYGITNLDVFMTNIEPVWDGEKNWANPWLVTIELVLV